MDSPGGDAGGEAPRTSKWSLCCFFREESFSGLPFDNLQMQA